MTQLTTLPASQSHTTEFDRHLRLADAPAGPGHYAVELPIEWMALVGIHGGYLTALAAHAAEVLSGGRRVRTSSTSFVRAAHPGPAELTVTEIRRGRSITTAVVEILQEDRVVTSSRLTLGGELHGTEWRPVEPIALPAPGECVPITPREPSPHFDRAEALLDPSSLPFTDGPRAMVRGYLRPLEPRPIDAAWLAMASDWFPPPAFVRLEPPLGGISIDLTTHVHQPLAPLAEGTWLTASFEITTSSGGIATEHGRIATVEGLVIAESLQTRWMVSR